MTVTFRPAVRQNTPLIIGIAGPTKSGKTYSAHRMAIGLAAGGRIVMVNAEGPKGHQYVHKFTYDTCDLEPPFRPTLYTEALREAAKLNPAVVIVDSASHMHDGPGGMLEWHEEIVRRMSRGDETKRDRMNFAAWVEPKAAENEFIYTMLGMKCHVILCFRAKEKIKLVRGQDPIELGWQPIAGERVAFETIFTLTLPPFSKGMPDLEISQMREPFDTLVPKGKPIDEELGRELAKWATVAKTPANPASQDANASAADELAALLKKHGLDAKDPETKKRCSDLFQDVYGTRAWSAIIRLDPAVIREGVAKIEAQMSPLADQVRAARAELMPPLADDEFEQLTENVAGVRDVAAAEPSYLTDLLELLRGYVAGEEIAVKTVDLVRKAVA